MQLQLRPAVPRFHPLLRPMYRRAGFAGMRGLGDGTCQVPQPGVPMVYPACPTSAPISSGAPAATYTSTGSSPAVYQPYTPVAVPSCTLDTQPGGAAFSSACIAQLLAAQQQNMQLANNANFVVDYTNCVNQGLSPATCASRTYGLTPAGGYTSDASVQGTSVILDANGNPVSGVPVYTGGPLPGMTPATSPSAGAASLKFSNLTSGNNSQLQVGDRWQIQISNAKPNAAVSVTGGQNGAHDTTPMGSSDSSGNWTSNGQITAAQVGSWSEAWSVGGQNVGQFQFTVAPASGAPGTTPSTSTASTPATGQTTTGSFMDILTKTTSIGGTSIPDWALIGGALVAAYFLFMRGK